MKNLILMLSSLIFLFSCSSLDESESLNLKKAQLAHSKYNNINNDFSYNEYKSLIIKYGKNNKYPNISK